MQACFTTRKEAAAGEMAQGRKGILSNYTFLVGLGFFSCVISDASWQNKRLPSPPSPLQPTFGHEIIARVVHKTVLAE